MSKESPGDAALKMVLMDSVYSGHLADAARIIRRETCTSVLRFVDS